MKTLLDEILQTLDVKQSVAHIEWLTENTPNRISGKGQDRRAAEYICKKMDEYGLETNLLEFEAYNSHPGSSEVVVTCPVEKKLASLPCCHINSTPPEGQEF